MEWMLLPLRRYADFSGRSRRLEFWMFTLFTVLVYAVAGVVMVALFATTGGTRGEPSGMAVAMAIIIVALVWLGLLVPSIAVQVRRFHDQNMSGAFVALTFGLSVVIPLIGWIVTIVFMSMPGTAGPNQYGPDPLDPEGARHLGEVFG